MMKGRFDSMLARTAREGAGVAREAIGGAALLVLLMVAVAVLVVAHLWGEWAARGASAVAAVAFYAARGDARVRGVLGALVERLRRAGAG